jgi:hypothetical protein
MKTCIKAGFVIVSAVVAALVAVPSVPNLSRAAGPWYVAPSGNDGNSCQSPVCNI